MPLVALALLVSACDGSSSHVLASHGVRVLVPAGWERVRPAVTNPRTLLVAGTPGVRPKPSRCTQAAYRIPAAGAMVVVIRWSSVAEAGGAPRPGRAPLRRLVAVTKPTFECFAGRGAVADLLLGGKRYQVGVLVGDRASADRVRQALAVARSFETAG